MRETLHARLQPVLLAGARRVRGVRLRALTLAVAALIAIGVVSGVALARTSAAPIGTGVVAIKTTLAGQGGAAAGTGMVLTSSGEILTNNHVIRGATTVKVVVPGTSRTYTAKVVGYDVTDDVAVLQTVGASNLKTVATSGSKLSVGDAVTAVGNAGGTSTLTTATGTITGLKRSVVVSDDSGGTARLTGMIAASAAVQPGDSGGPLLDSAGKVIGMDTAGSTGYVSRSATATQAYAIPIAKALSLARQIESGQSSTRVHIGATPFLGIQVASTTGGGGLSSAGAVVAGVVSGTPAESAGLAAGDVITAIDGHSISSSSSVTSILLTKQPGAKVTISFTDQSGGSHSTTVTLASGPAQ
jgi:S1-C subfamily serine protease